MDSLTQPLLRIALAAGVSLAVFSLHPAVLGDVLINEIDPQTQVFTTALDALEFVELYNNSEDAQLLDGYVLVLYDGSTALSYDAIDLSGYSIPGKGYFVIGSSGVPRVNLVHPLTSPLKADSWIRVTLTGGQAIALFRNASVTDFPPGTSSSTATKYPIADAIVQSAAIPFYNNTLRNTFNPGQVPPSEGFASDSKRISLGRSTDGAGGPRITTQWKRLIPTPGFSNNGNLEAANSPALPGLKVTVNGGTAFATAAENGAPFTITVQVDRTVSTGAVNVVLNSLDPSEILIPTAGDNHRLDLAEGQLSATKTVTVHPVDDQWVDGEQLVYFEARPDSDAYQTGTGWLQITDNDTAPLSPLVISEVNVNQGALGWPQGGGDANQDGVASDGDHFIEVVNTGAEFVSLAGYRLESRKGVWLNFPAQTGLAPGAALVVFSKVEPTFVGLTGDFGQAQVFGSSSGQTVWHGGDVVRLFNESVQEIAGHVFAPAQVGSNTRSGNPAVGAPSSFPIDGRGHGLVASSGGQFGRLSSAGTNFDNSPYVPLGSGDTIGLTLGRGKGDGLTPASDFSELEGDGVVYLQVQRAVSANTNYDLVVQLNLAETDALSFASPQSDNGGLVTIPSGQTAVWVPLTVKSHDGISPDGFRPLTISAQAAAHRNNAVTGRVFDDKVRIVPADTLVSELEPATLVQIERLSAARTEAVTLTLRLEGMGASLDSSPNPDERDLLLSGAGPFPVALKVLANPSGLDQSFTVRAFSEDERDLAVSGSVTIKDDTLNFSAPRVAYSELEAPGQAFLQRSSGLIRPVTVVLEIVTEPAESAVSAVFADDSQATKILSLPTAADQPLSLSFLPDALHEGGPDRSFKIRASANGLFFDSPKIDVLNDYIKVSPGQAIATQVLALPPPISLERAPGRNELVTFDLTLIPDEDSAAAAIFKGSANAVTLNWGDIAPTAPELSFLWFTQPSRAFTIEAKSRGQEQMSSALISVTGLSAGLDAWATRFNLDQRPAALRELLASDTDEDSANGLLEYAGGTDPKNPAPPPSNNIEIKDNIETTANGDLILDFKVGEDARTDPSITGAAQWWSSDSLLDESWSSLGLANFVSEEGVFRLELNAPLDPGARFYRLFLAPLAP